MLEFLNMASSSPPPCLELVALVLLASVVAGQFPIKFDCPQLPPLSRPAETVYELKPQDIKVVMALGDSITAGEVMNIMQTIATSIIIL